jgi:hypothetical protein
MEVSTVDDVPEVASRGTVAVVGDCRAVLWSDGYDWYLLEGRIADPAVVRTDVERPGTALCEAVSGGATPRG